MNALGDIKDKVAIVAGGASGIGSATARLLAESGIKVVVNYHRNQKGADETVAAIRQGGGQAVAIRADVRLADDCAALAGAATSHFGVPRRDRHPVPPGVPDAGSGKEVGRRDSHRPTGNPDGGRAGHSLPVLTGRKLSLR